MRQARRYEGGARVVDDERLDRRLGELRKELSNRSVPVDDLGREPRGLRLDLELDTAHHRTYEDSFRIAATCNLNNMVKRLVVLREKGKEDSHGDFNQRTKQLFEQIRRAVEDEARKRLDSDAPTTTSRVEEQ